MFTIVKKKAFSTVYNCKFISIYICNMKNDLHLATKFLYHPIRGRYVVLDQIDTFLKTFHSAFKIKEIGKSELGKTISSITFGQGKTKILIWSQMHGNESTSTKGLIDFLNYCRIEPIFYSFIKEKFMVCVIPMLNPDGAELYTRENANKVDLNRDALECTQKESLILRQLVNEFQPDYCFNMHDQRTIFGLIETQKPATMSFLTAAFDETRTFNETRVKAANIINGIVKNLNNYIPGQVGRFDDSFNLNCTGDYFTSIGIPTILFEAGHFQDDYERDEVRKYVFISLLSAFYSINENDIATSVLENYLNIFQNNKCFVDIIFKNVKIFENNVEKNINFAVQYSEFLRGNKIDFEAVIYQIVSETELFGHQVYDGKGELFDSIYGKFPKIGEKANFHIGNREFVNGKLVG